MININSSNSWLISSVLVVFLFVGVVSFVLVYSQTWEIDTKINTKKIKSIVLIVLPAIIALLISIRIVVTCAITVNKGSNVEYLNQYKVKDSKKYIYINNKKYSKSEEKYFQKKRTRAYKNWLFNKKQSKSEWVEISEDQYKSQTNYAGKEK